MASEHIISGCNHIQFTGLDIQILRRNSFIKVTEKRKTSQNILARHKLTIRTCLDFWQSAEVMKTLCHIMGNWGLWVGQCHSIDPHQHSPQYSLFLQDEKERTANVKYSWENLISAYPCSKTGFLTFGLRFNIRCCLVSLKLYTMPRFTLPEKPGRYLSNMDYLLWKSY